MKNPKHSPRRPKSRPLSRKATPLDISALTVAQLAALLTKAAGARLYVAQVRADLKAGAPADAAGRINLIHYTAWLLKQGHRA